MLGRGDKSMIRDKSTYNEDSFLIAQTEVVFR